VVTSLDPLKIFSLPIIFLGVVAVVTNFKFGAQSCLWIDWSYSHQILYRCRLYWVSSRVITIYILVGMVRVTWPLGFLGNNR